MTSLTKVNGEASKKPSENGFNASRNSKKSTFSAQFDRLKHPFNERLKKAEDTSKNAQAHVENACINDTLKIPLTPNSSPPGQGIPCSHFHYPPCHCPPPGTPPSPNDLWDLQFCRWWGWNWVRKEEGLKASVKLQNQGCDCDLKAGISSPIKKRFNPFRRQKPHRKKAAAKNPDFFTWINRVVSGKRSHRGHQVTEKEKRQLQDLYDTPCSSMTFNSCPKKDWECRSVKLKGEYECYCDSGRETSRSTIIIEKKARCCCEETSSSNEAFCNLAHPCCTSSNEDSTECISVKLEAPCPRAKKMSCKRTNHVCHCNTHPPCQIPRLHHKTMPPKPSCRYPTLCFTDPPVAHQKNRCPYPIPVRCKHDEECRCLVKAKKEENVKPIKSKKRCKKLSKKYYCCPCCCCRCCCVNHICCHHCLCPCCQNFKEEKTKAKEPQNLTEQKVLCMSQALEKGQFISPLSGKIYGLNPPLKTLNPLNNENKLPKPLGLMSNFNQNPQLVLNNKNDSEHEVILSAVCDAILSSKLPDDIETFQRSFERFPNVSNKEWLFAEEENVSTINAQLIGGPPTIQESYRQVLNPNDKFLNFPPHPSTLFASRGTSISTQFLEKPNLYDTLFAKINHKAVSVKTTSMESDPEVIEKIVLPSHLKDSRTMQTFVDNKFDDLKSSFMETSTFHNSNHKRSKIPIYKSLFHLKQKSSSKNRSNDAATISSGNTISESKGSLSTPSIFKLKYKILREKDKPTLVDPGSARCKIIKVEKSNHAGRSNKERLFFKFKRNINK